jgi:hypothetical protein
VLSPEPQATLEGPRAPFLGRVAIPGYGSIYRGFGQESGSTGTSDWDQPVETGEKSGTVNGRRSSRMVLRVPLLINAVDSTAETEWEQVQTVVVSLHGGMLRTQQQFGVGTVLDIRLPNAGRSARARVAWMSAKYSSQGADLGFEILDDAGCWGIKFPPDRRSTPQAFQA